MRFIGDVHGEFQQYERLIAEVDQSVQIGDMGIGFRQSNADGVVECPIPPYETMKREGNHRFIRGNQDDPGEVIGHELCIADGHIEGDTFYCGGALSANRANRTEGLNWWPGEELSANELLVVRAKYLDNKPKLMVTHDCPHSVAETILRHHQLDKTVAPSRSRHSFQEMWELYKPDIWVFGHWHLSMDKIIAGTRFICLDKLEVIDL